MILSFSTKFPKTAGKLANKPTHFVEKIWQSFYEDYQKETFEFYQKNLQKVNRLNIYFEDIKFQPKKHSLRSDKNNRWKLGYHIDFFINARQPNMTRFAPKLPVKGVQRISIEIDKDYKSVVIDGKVFYEENKNFKTQYEAMLLLANNDGFDSVEDFFAYFNTDFTGKIIHWTNLKY